VARSVLTEKRIVHICSTRWLPRRAEFAAQVFRMRDAGNDETIKVTTMGKGQMNQSKICERCQFISLHQHLHHL
jgi:hypothetical protein